MDSIAIDVTVILICRRILFYFLENSYAVGEQTVPRVSQFYQPVEWQYIRRHRSRSARRPIYWIDAAIVADYWIFVRQSLFIGRNDTQFDPISTSGQCRHANGQIFRPSRRASAYAVDDVGYVATQCLALGLLRSVYFQLQEIITCHRPIRTENPQRFVPETTSFRQSHRRSRPARIGRHFGRESDESARCLTGKEFFSDMFIFFSNCKDML